MSEIEAAISGSRISERATKDQQRKTFLEGAQELQDMETRVTKQLRTQCPLWMGSTRR